MALSDPFGLLRWFGPLLLHFQHYKTPNRWKNKVRSIFFVFDKQMNKKSAII